MPHYIGLDLGGTNLKAGVVDEHGKPVAKLSMPSETEQGPDRVLAVMADAARAVAEKADMSLDDVAAIGCGAPGPVDFDNGIVLAAPNLPGWTNIPVRDRIREATGRPTVLENDANAAAMGEFWAGAGRDKSIRHLIMLTLGTGIGGGIIIDGQMLHGGFGYGGEVGHMIVDPNGPRWTSGSPGCFEQYASAASAGRPAASRIVPSVARAIALPGFSASTERTVPSASSNRPASAASFARSIRPTNATASFGSTSPSPRDPSVAAPDDSEGGATPVT